MHENSPLIAIVFDQNSESRAWERFCELSSDSALLDLLKPMVALESSADELRRLVEAGATLKLVHDSEFGDPEEDFATALFNRGFKFDTDGIETLDVWADEDVLEALDRDSIHLLVIGPDGDFFLQFVAADVA